MELLVPIVLYGWFPVALMIFRDLRGHRALIVTYIVAWLFLPTDELAFRGLPDYTKSSATSLAVLLSVLVFDFRKLIAFRPRLLDVPMFIFCFSPIPSALWNELGTWDGCSNTLKLTALWGLPYFFGRLYFDSFDKVTDLARGIFVGGLVYVPLCLVEIRMSPQIYNWVYGFRPSTLHSFRYGGWRPLVFLSNGLELGMWMTAACLMGFALWYSGATKRVWGVPMAVAFSVLFVVTVLCKSTGALILLLGGMVTFVGMRLLRMPFPALAIALVPLIYIPMRVAQVTDGSEIAAAAQGVFGAERAQSLEFRFRNEVLLVRHALNSAWFGWGGWGRELVEDPFAEKRTVIDGFWIVTFGKQGLLGMVSAYVAFITAPCIVCWRFCRRRWRFSDVGAAIAIAVLLLLYMIDCLLNSMANAVYPLCLGALTTLCVTPSSKLTGPGGGQVQYVYEEDLVEVETPQRSRLWPPAADDFQHVGQASQTIGESGTDAPPLIDATSSDPNFED